MAVITGRQQDIWESLGTGLGSGVQKGISDRLKQLAENKLKELQNKRLFDSLLAADVPENVARAVVTSPKSMQREVFKGLLGRSKDSAAALTQMSQQQPESFGESQAPAVGQQRKIGDLYKLRLKQLKHAKKGSKEGVISSLLFKKEGLLPEELEIVTGTEINDNIIRYFLDKTNNNPKKAKKLARKFGYKV